VAAGDLIERGTVAFARHRHQTLVGLGAQKHARKPS
jgi:hypothetical protein